MFLFILVMFLRISALILENEPLFLALGGLGWSLCKKQ